MTLRSKFTDACHYSDNAMELHVVKNVIFSTIQYLTVEL